MEIILTENEYKHILNESEWYKSRMIEYRDSLFRIEAILESSNVENILPYTYKNIKREMDKY